MRLSLTSVIYGVEGLSPIRMGLMFISYVNPALRPSAFTLGFILSARLRGLNIRLFTLAVSPHLSANIFKVCVERFQIHLKDTAHAAKLTFLFAVFNKRFYKGER